MQGEQPQTEDLLRPYEVTDVRTRVPIAAGIAVAAVLYDGMVMRIRRVLHHEPPRPCHRHAVARHARREYAVKHVDAVPYPREEVVGCSDAHEVARFLLGQKLCRIGEDLLHQLMRLADTQPADGIARQIELRYGGGMPCAQVAVHPALHDAEKPLPLRARHRIAAADEPALCALRRGLRIVMIGGIRNALVERHDDIRAERALHLHRHLGREEFLRPVNMRAKRRPLLGDLTQIAEAEHLKSSAVREDRTVPVHEAMQSARLPHEFHSGAQEEMVGIAEDDPRAEITQLIG